MWVLQKIASALLAIVVMIIIFNVMFGNDGLLADTKGISLDLLKYAPKIDVGQEEVKAGKVKLTSSQASAVSSLQTKLETVLADKTNENCFFSYTGFDLDLGEDEKTAALHMTDQGEFVAFRMNNILAQEASYFEIKDINLCVVAGGQGESTNFYNHFVRGGPLVSPFFRPVQNLQIFFQDVYWGDGNVIRSADFGIGESLMDEDDNYESDGVLFLTKADESRNKRRAVCFFPTNYVNNHDEDGMDNDLFSKGKFLGNPKNVRECNGN